MAILCLLLIGVVVFSATLCFFADSLKGGLRPWRFWGLSMLWVFGCLFGQVDMSTLTLLASYWYMGAMVALLLRKRYRRRVLDGAADSDDEGVERQEKRLFRLAGVAALALLAAFFIRTSFAEPYRVASSSMLPALEKGQVVWGRRVNAETPVMIGEVVVFLHNGQKLTKRVAYAQAGSVRYDNAGALYLDGKLADWANSHAYYREGDTKRVVGQNNHSCTLRAEGLSCVIRADEVFVLGDNRNDSIDSRFFGAIKKSDIIARIDR